MVSSLRPAPALRNTKAALRAAIECGYLIMRPSVGYLPFTQEGADLFAQCPKGWKRPFDDPIPLRLGRQLVTLEDAPEFLSEDRSRKTL
jgi:hypothetical protein